MGHSRHVDDADGSPGAASRSGPAVPVALHEPNPELHDGRPR